MRDLMARLDAEMNQPLPTERLCQGILLSWRQYLVDIEQWGYRDARLERGFMSHDQIERWTEAFR